MPSQMKRLHVNHLKKWYQPNEAAATVAWSEIQPPPLLSGDLPCWEVSTDQPPNNRPPLDSALTLGQRLLPQATGNAIWVSFRYNPGKTTAIWHVIETPPGQVVWTTHRPVLWKRWETINREVAEIL